MVSMVLAAYSLFATNSFLQCNPSSKKLECKGTVSNPVGPVANTASGISNLGFTANWVASPGATAYMLDVSVSSNFSSFISIYYNNRNTGNVTSFFVTGLNPVTTYYYRVRGTNSSGTSGNSNVISLTTAADRGGPLGSYSQSDVRKFSQFLGGDFDLTPGGDGYYYTVSAYNRGDNQAHFLPLWRSADLITWTNLGIVWGNDQSPWLNQLAPGGDINAPEIHYINNNYWISYCFYNKDYFLSSSLKSTTGLPTGPYVDVKPGAPLAKPVYVDGSMFQDDNGNVYFLYAGDFIQQFNSTMTELTGSVMRLGGGGFEGVYLYKFNGVYYLTGAHNPNYDSYCNSSTSLFGPYGSAYCCLAKSGHSTLFTDKNGQLWSTWWGGGDSCGIIKMGIDGNGRLQPHIPATKNTGIASDSSNQQGLTVY